MLSSLGSSYISKKCFSDIFSRMSKMYCLIESLMNYLRLKDLCRKSKSPEKYLKSCIRSIFHLCVGILVCYSNPNYSKYFKQKYYNLLKPFQKWNKTTIENDRNNQNSEMPIWLRLEITEICWKNISNSNDSLISCRFINSNCDVNLR